MRRFDPQLEFWHFVETAERGPSEAGSPRFCKIKPAFLRCTANTTGIRVDHGACQIPFPARRAAWQSFGTVFALSGESGDPKQASHLDQRVDCESQGTRETWSNRPTRR